MKNNKRIIFHVDVNSAFLSWESVHRLSLAKASDSPNDTLDLRTIASAVGGDPKSRHGIILAKSTIARSFGIVTGEPIASALSKCPNLFVVPPNFSIYSQYSRQLMELLSNYTPVIHPFSIDEAFLDMTSTCHLFGDPVTVAHMLKERIYKELHFTVNVGISSNKLLAKMASDFKKPNLCHTLFPEEIEQKMWPLPVEELFFVGQSAMKKFHALGIRTIGDLANSNLDILQSHVGKKYGSLIHAYANGMDEDPVIIEDEPSKGIGNSITLKKDVQTFESAHQVLLALCETVASRLRMSQMKCNCITLEMKDADFSTKTHQTTLQTPTNSTMELYETSKKLLKESWSLFPLRLLGIRTTKLDHTDFSQLTLFEPMNKVKQQKLEEAIDTIRNRYGDASIKRATFLKDELQDKYEKE